MHMFNNSRIQRTIRRIVWICVAVILLPDGVTSQTQTGKASFYSKRATGSRTANGERLHHDSLTCAHRSYPFGTILKVTNVLNGKQVVVRVNDRGPFRKGRIIDLSWGAAQSIGMIAQGIAPVTVEKISEMNIPYKPEDEEIPKLEFEVADIEEGIIPIWQHQKLQIDQQKVNRSMRVTVNKAAVSQPSTKRTEEKNKDAFEEINTKPNSSKAYLKRQSQSQ